MDDSKGSKKCPSCGSTEFLIDRQAGETVCKKCGTVIEEDTIDYGQEWREFSGDAGQNKRRTGNPLTYIKHDKGVSTKIGGVGDLGRISGSERKRISRLRKWHSRISTALERNVKYALAELRRVGSFLNIPHVAMEEAAKIYRNAAEKGLVRGRSMESVVAGALYAACRRQKFPRTLDEISETFSIDKKEIGKTYRFICRELGIRILPTFPLDYIYRFASELKLNPKTISKSVEIINKAQEVEITSGKGPMGVAAAALYVATLLCNERKTQREVADVAGVTEVTIRNRYKELIDKLKLGDVEKGQ
jgi:transcription initiation factor TFIIB